MKLLMHICCAPCANLPIDVLRADGIDLTGYWYNPNIHPFTEYRAERTRYNVLLEQQTGSLPLDTTKVDSFAKGSPTRATTTTAASGGNREELLGQRPAGRECKTLHEADAGSRNPDAGTVTAVTERFNPESDGSDPQKEAHSDAPAGQ